MSKDDTTDDIIPRAPRRLTQDEFGKFLELHQAQPWLVKKQKEFWALDSLCQDLDEQNLIVNLLYNFTYVTSSEYDERLKELAEQIINQWDFSAKKTQLVACDNTDRPDSSKKVLQDLKSYLNQVGDGWKENNLSTSISEATKEARLKTFPQMVLIDEFTGTGQTLAEELTLLNTELENSEVETKLKVCVIASMEASKQRIETHLPIEDYFSSIWLKKGISDYYSGEELSLAKQKMERLESELNQGKGYHKFGYGESEALYSMEAGNTPNNVFPIFYLRELKNGEKRLTLLRRM